MFFFFLSLFVFGRMFKILNKHLKHIYRALQIIPLILYYHLNPLKKKNNAKHEMPKSHH